MELTIYPNPATTGKHTFVIFKNPVSGQSAKVQLLSNEGLSIKTLQLDQLPVGRNSFNFDLSRIPAGFYSITIIPEQGKMQSGKVSIIKD